tara:strand:- start:3651 stop:4943 length:1293 start_codon:yes stop_codon:yes gene_type:complete
MLSTSLVSFCDPINNHFISFCSDSVDYFSLLSKTFTLSIPFFIVLQLLSEKNLFKFPKAIFFLFGIFILILYFFDGILGAKFLEDSVYFQHQFYIYFLLLVLLVSFASFFNMSMHSFWKFNNILFIKLLQVMVRCVFFVVLYVLVLYVFDYFFNKEFTFYIYHIGIIFIFGIFGCLYFLSHIPNDLTSLEELTPYPKFYYLISSLYFLPTSIFFIFISYAYFAFYYVLDWVFHIEITIFTLLGIGFGLFFLIQVELLRTRSTNKVTLFFLKYFYWFILPLSAVNLFYLTQFWFLNGITEFWYISWVLLAWVLLVCFYFIYSRRKDIRLVPVTLFIVCVFLATGPFMPFNISCRSQVYQLKSILVEEGLFKDNQISFAQKPEFSYENEVKLKNILAFLDEHHRLGLLKSIYPYTIALESLTLRRVLIDFNL